MGYRTTSHQRKLQTGFGSPPFMFVPGLLIIIATTFESWITLMLVSIGSILLITLLYRQIMKLAKTKLVETVQNLES